MLTSRRKLGDFGEGLAKKYLKKKGYKIIEKNFQARFGEIDLVAKKGPEIIFVEVKTRTSPAFGLPEEAVNFKKQAKLAKTAEIYLAKNNLLGSPYRIDTIALEIDESSKEVKIRHLENAVRGLSR